MAAWRLEDSADGSRPCDVKDGDALEECGYRGSRCGGGGYDGSGGLHWGACE